MPEFERALTVQDYRDNLAGCNVIGLGFDYTRNLLERFGVIFPEGAELEEWQTIAKATAVGRELNEGDAEKNAEAQEGLKAARTVCVYRYRVRAPTDAGWGAHIEQEPTPITSGRPNESFELGLFAATLKHNRAADAEFQALQSFARCCFDDLGWRLYGSAPSDQCGIEGEMWLYMSEVPCLSCVGAMAQFRRLFPGVNLKVAFSMGRQPVVVTNCETSCRGAMSSDTRSRSFTMPAPKAKAQPTQSRAEQVRELLRAPSAVYDMSASDAIRGKVSIGGVLCSDEADPECVSIRAWDVSAPSMPANMRPSPTAPRVYELGGRLSMNANRTGFQPSTSDSSNLWANYGGASAAKVPHAPSQFAQVANPSTDPHVGNSGVNLTGSSETARSSESVGLAVGSRATDLSPDPWLAWQTPKPLASLGSSGSSRAGYKLNPAGDDDCQSVSVKHSADSTIAPGFAAAYDSAALSTHDADDAVGALTSKSVKQTGAQSFY